DGCQHVHEPELCAIPLRHLDCLLKGRARGAREIRRVQDAANAAHEVRLLSPVSSGCGLRLVSFVGRAFPNFVGASTGASGARNSRIGMVVPRSTDSATLPRMRRPIPVRPCVLITIRSALFKRAASTMADAADPYHTDVSTRFARCSLRRAAT